MAHSVIDLGHNGAARSVYAEEDNYSYLLDFQNRDEIRAILDHNSRVRYLQKKFNEKSKARGRLVANIPITVYMNWEKEWKKERKDTMTWHEFLIGRLNSRDWSQLKVIDETKLHVPDNNKSANWR